MSKFNDIFEDQYRFALKSINYSAMVSDNGQLGSSIEFGDRFEIRNLVGQELHVDYLRELRLPQSENNSLSICFESIYTLRKGVMLDDALRAELPTILAEPLCSSEIYARASILVSQILLVGTAGTVVLPPQYIGSTSVSE